MHTVDHWEPADTVDTAAAADTAAVDGGSHAVSSLILLPAGVELVVRPGYRRPGDWWSVVAELGSQTVLHSYDLSTQLLHTLRKDWNVATSGFLT